jgi:4-diphosphocytidyl-2-C-methyl-D-erythritol kinase
VKIRAPAKINLSLRVIGQRRDGYHLLDTIMVPVSLYDEIEIRKIRPARAKKGKADPLIRVTCDHPLVPRGEKNIAHRAARLLSGPDASNRFMFIFASGYRWGRVWEEAAPMQRRL